MSKVKGHGFRIYGVTYYVTFFGSLSVKRSPKPSYIDSRYFTAILMQLSNDLDLPTQKVKVIRPKLSKNTQKRVINYVYGQTRCR